LGPEIIESLPLADIETIEDLVSLAGKVESLDRQIEERRGKSAGFEKKERKPEPYNNLTRRDANEEKPRGPPKDSKGEPPSNTSNATSKRGIRCYCSDHTGHIGKDYIFTKTINGKPTKLPKSESEILDKVNNIQGPHLAMNANGARGTAG